jgi:hypothetical protein
MKGSKVLCWTAAVAAAAFGLGLWASTGLGRCQSGEALPQELLWLTEEFHPQPEQARRILAIHRAYCQGCRERCRELCLLGEKILEKAGEGKKGKPDLETLIEKETHLRRECWQKMFAYFQAVATELGEEKGRRYLAQVLPRALDGLGPGGGNPQQVTVLPTEKD